MKIGHLVGRGKLAELFIECGVVSCDLSHPFPPVLFTASVMVEVRDRPNFLERSKDPCPVSRSLRICGIDPDPLGASKSGMENEHEHSIY